MLRVWNVAMSRQGSKGTTLARRGEHSVRAPMSFLSSSEGLGKWVLMELKKNKELCLATEPLERVHELLQCGDKQSASCCIRFWFKMFYITWTAGKHKAASQHAANAVFTFAAEQIYSTERQEESGVGMGRARWGAVQRRLIRTCASQPAVFPGSFLPPDVPNRLCRGNAQSGMLKEYPGYTLLQCRSQQEDLRARNQWPVARPSKPTSCPCRDQSYCHTFKDIPTVILPDDTLYLNVQKDWLMWKVFLRYLKWKTFR